MTSLRFALGLLLGFIGPLAAVEIFARYQPPLDISLYLGEKSPLSGSFKPDPAIGADYVSFEAFRSAYGGRFDELDPFEAKQPVWAWFGNSFVQAPGMLGDTAQAAMPDRLMVYLRKNEPLNVRAAQLRLLLRQGLRPQRVIFVLLPIDTSLSPRQPISSIDVTEHGAITYRPRMPAPPLDKLIEHSRLALLGWIRSGRHYADPSYKPSSAMTSVSPHVVDDIQRLMQAIAASARDNAVPVTIVLLPNREQIYGKAGFMLQDTITGIAKANGLDVYDGRHVFDDIVNKPGIFLPDYHFNPKGNDIVLTALLKHLGATPAQNPARGEQ